MGIAVDVNRYGGDL